MTSSVVTKQKHYINCSGTSKDGPIRMIVAQAARLRAELQAGDGARPQPASKQGSIVSSKAKPTIDLHCIHKLVSHPAGQQKNSIIIFIAGLPRNRLRPPFPVHSEFLGNVMHTCTWTSSYEYYLLLASLCFLCANCPYMIGGRCFHVEVGHPLPWSTIP